MKGSKDSLQDAGLEIFLRRRMLASNGGRLGLGDLRKEWGSDHLRGSDLDLALTYLLGEDLIRAAGGPAEDPCYAITAEGEQRARTSSIARIKARRRLKARLRTLRNAVLALAPKKKPVEARRRYTDFLSDRTRTDVPSKG